MTKTLITFVSTNVPFMKQLSLELHLDAIHITSLTQ